MITYFFFLVIFFHQYIIEYYFFGFFGYILNIFGLLNNSNIFDCTNTKYYLYIEEHIQSMSYNNLKIIIINGIMIFLAFSLFIAFMGINSAKTLFINIGFPLYGNKRYLTIKLVIFNFNLLYSIISMLNSKVRIIATMIVIILILLIILIDIYLSFYHFSYYPSNLTRMCVFIEFFSFISIIIEIILYLSNFKLKYIAYNISKFLFLLLNSFLFTCLFINKKKEYSKRIFAENLFNKTFKILNPNDIYYYISTFIQYSENKKKNYIKLFNLIQYHILLCNKNDCPCQIIIPRFMVYSMFTNFTETKNNDSENEKLSKNNGNINKIDNNINSIKSSLNNIPKQNFKKILSDSSINLKNSNINKDNNILNKLTEKSNVRFKNRSSTIIANYSKKNNVKKSLTILGENNNETNKNIENNKNNYNYNNKKEEGLNKKNNENNQKYSKEKIINDKKNKLKYEQFQIIGEQEIINRINFLYTSKNYDLLKTYIYIHLQYLIKIKNNYRLALYFSGKYSMCGIKFNFLEKYYLYEIKKYIIKNIFQKTNLEIIKDSFIIKYREENFSLKKIINYIYFYQIVKNLLKTSCEKIIYFYKFRRELHDPLTFQKYKKSKIYPVINASIEIQTSIKKLKFIIRNYYKEERHNIESIELCYLITNFFKLIEGKIKTDILKYISPILYFKELHFKKLLNEFQIFMMNNPLIIYLTKKDTFSIKYFTNIFLEKLNYSYLDLKDKDFHEKLFPGEKKLIKEHTLIMKQFLFSNNNFYGKSETFIKSKEGYLISINFTCKIFPTFISDFYIIVNIIFNDDKMRNNKNSNEFNKKTINLSKMNNKLINEYFFLLGSDFEFYGLSKNFYLEYYLNQNMFRKLKLNFCKFFCVDENQLTKQIHKEKKMLKEYNNIKQKITLKEVNKAYTIFQNIEIKNVFKIREEKILTNYFFPPIYIYDKIDKNKLIKNFPEIIKIIDELGLNYEWYLTIEDLKERLTCDNYFQNKKQSKIVKKMTQRQNTIINFNEEIKKSAIKNLNNMNNMQFVIKKNLQYFEVIYILKKMGSLKYYIVNLYETINNSLSSNKVFPKYQSSSSKILNLISSNSPKKPMKVNNLNLPSSENSDEKSNDRNERSKSSKVTSFILEPKVKIDNLKSKNLNTNNKENGFKLSLKKNESNNSFNSILDNISFNKNKENNDNNEVKDLKDNLHYQKTQKISFDALKKKNGSKKTLDSLLENFSSKKISISNSNNDIIKNKNEILKNKKYSLGNSEYFKTMKINQENPEEEEIELLITKDKFNELIKKYNIRNLIFIFILFTMMILSLIFIYCRYLICTSDSAQSSNVFNAVIILEMLKIDIYHYSLLSLFFCLDENLTPADKLKINEEAEIKLHETLDHIKILQDKVNIIINNKLHVSFYDILKQRFIIKILNNDWTIFEKKTDLINEVRKLSYITYDLRFKNNSCNIQTFYEYLNKGTEIYINGEVNEANGIEKSFYYFFNNIFVNYRDMFKKLIEEAIKILIYLGYIFLIKLLYYVIGILIISIIFIIIYLIKFYYDYSYYQLLFFYYYIIKIEQLEFEKQIFYLYKIIHEFNFNNINYFEYIKINSNLIDYSEDLSQISYLNHTPNKNMISNSFSDSKKNNKKLSFINSDKKGSNNNLNFNKKILNEDLNESLNGSSLLFLNKDKTSSNNKGNNNLYNEDENKQKNFYKEESIDSFLIASKKIIPNILKISLIFNLICIIIYIIVSVLDIIEIRREKKMWDFNVYLSINILERIPNIMEMILYASLVVITDNRNLLKGSPFNNNQISYLKYFKSKSLYYSENIMNKYLRNDFFGELLRDNLKNNHIFNNYLFQETYDAFVNTKIWEKNLNLQGAFCAYAGLGKLLYYKKETTSYDLIQKSESLGLKCLEKGDEMNNSGIQLEINYVLEEIETKYIEFITYNNSNLSLKEARKKFFGSKNIKRIFNDIYFSFLFYYNSIIYALDYDFLVINIYLAEFQIIISQILFVANLCVLICMAFSFLINERHKNLFGYFVEMPNTS